MGNSVTPITLEYIVPSWSITAIAYGDYSALSNDDIAALESFLERIEKDTLGASYTTEFLDDMNFCRSNDVHSLGDECITLLIHVL